MRRISTDLLADVRNGSPGLRGPVKCGSESTVIAPPPDDKKDCIVRSSCRQKVLEIFLRFSFHTTCDWPPRGALTASSKERPSLLKLMEKLKVAIFVVGDCFGDDGGFV